MTATGYVEQDQTSRKDSRDSNAKSSISNLLQSLHINGLYRDEILLFFSGLRWIED